MSDAKKIIPANLFDLKPFEKVCDAKNPVPVAPFDLDIFIKRHNDIIQITDDEGHKYPFDVEFTDKLEYCGREDNCRLYKIFFGAAKAKIILAVDKDNFISKIVTSADVKNPDAVNSFSGILIIILRNVGLNVPEIQAVNAMIQNDADLIFHWCEETQRFIFVTALTSENNIYMGFSAAVD
ncbi:MAG: hypothetical protein IJU91_04935 [Selenomonadaceae bacterium]|nr:hypothetical protein [Selenomonadaceae bacterium]